jgi:replication fork protection complex subunit Tof1/Swi1
VTAFFATILKDIRMERSKIRPSDNIRTFYLARFFMEYLLRSRRQESEAAVKRKEKGIVDDPEVVAKRMMPLGLVGEMAEMDSVRWVVMRMKFSMDERVCPFRMTALMEAACMDGTSS